MTVYADYNDPKPQYLDANGDPYSGGKLYFYEAGTSTPLTVYTTRTGTAHSSPIILNSAGRIPGSNAVFVPVETDFKVVLHDSSDVEVFSVDNLYVGIDTENIVSGAITYAKIQDVS